MYKLKDVENKVYRLIVLFMKQEKQISTSKADLTYQPLNVWQLLEQHGEHSFSKKSDQSRPRTDTDC